MDITRFTENETYTYLNQAFNPPTLSEELTEECFFTEWHGVRNHLKAVLDQFGQDDAYGQGDFCLGDSASLSRGIGVCLTSSRLLMSDLIPVVTELLRSLSIDYEVNFTIETQDGACQLFVSRDTVKAWIPDDLLSRLLPDKSDHP